MAKNRNEEEEKELKGLESVIVEGKGADEALKKLDHTDRWNVVMSTLNGGEQNYQGVSSTDSAQNSSAYDFAEAYAANHGETVDTRDKNSLLKYFEDRIIDLTKKTALGYFEDYKGEIFKKVRESKGKTLANLVLQTPVVETKDEKLKPYVEAHKKFAKIARILQEYSQDSKNVDITEEAMKLAKDEITAELKENKYLTDKDIKYAVSCFQRQLKDEDNAKAYLANKSSEAANKFLKLFKEGEKVDEENLANYAIGAYMRGYEASKKPEEKLGIIRALNKVYNTEEKKK
jgi:hypothetical protein